MSPVVPRTDFQCTPFDDVRPSLGLVDERQRAPLVLVFLRLDFKFPARPPRHGTDQAPIQVDITITLACRGCSNCTRCPTLCLNKAVPVSLFGPDKIIVLSHGNNNPGRAEARKAFELAAVHQFSFPSE
jgi:hypothetical protein